MNYYSGILQALVSHYSFYWFKYGVWQLRLSGLFLNVTALILATRFIYLQNQNAAVLFLLLIGQSAIYLNSARIAWEVNTFTMIFIMTMILIIRKVIKKNASYRPAFIFLYLFINSLATYNHIIYASVTLALTTGIFLWSVYNPKSYYFHFIPLGLFSLLNSLLLFIIAKYFSGILQPKFFPSFIACAMFLFWLESVLSCKLLESQVNINCKIPKIFIRVSVIIGVFFFVFFHGIAVIDVFSNYKVFKNVYAFNSGWLIRYFYLTFSLCLCFFSVYYISKDLQIKGPASIPAFIILMYVATFSLFTTSNSSRYYLILFFLLAMYLSLRLSRTQFRKPIVSFTLISFLISISIISSVFLTGIKAYKVYQVHIGNSEESSGHFLPKKNLIDSISKYRVNRIDYLTDRYFIEQPILFYKTIQPWKIAYGSEAIIDYRGINGGYLIFIRHNP